MTCDKSTLTNQAVLTSILNVRPIPTSDVNMPPAAACFGATKPNNKK